MRRIVLVLAIMVSSPMAALVVLVTIDPGGSGSTSEDGGRNDLVVPLAVASTAVALGGHLALGLALRVQSGRISRAERDLGQSGRFSARAERNRLRAMPVVRVGVVVVGIAWLIAPRVGGIGRAAVVSVAVGVQIPALLVGLASIHGQRVLCSGLRADPDQSAREPADDNR